jgi:3-hydroxyisobutyrate dehydrogenase
MKVAVLGLGSMGRAFAIRAQERGHEVVGWNRTPREVDLPTAGSPQEAVAGTDVVLVVVADGPAVEAVLTAELLGSLRPEALVAVACTVAPQTVRAIDLPGRVLDTPVLGSPSAIAAGQGRFYVGGPDEAVARVTPLLADLGAGVMHCGPLGTGAVLKIVSNLQLVVGVAALAEAIATARGHGVDDALLRTVFTDSGVVSETSRIRLDTLLDPTHPGWFTPALAGKDITLALDLAAEAGLGTALGPAAAELLTRVAGGDWADFSAVIEGL